MDLTLGAEVHPMGEPAKRGLVIRVSQGWIRVRWHDSGRGDTSHRPAQLRRVCGPIWRYHYLRPP